MYCIEFTIAYQGELLDRRCQFINASSFEEAIQKLVGYVINPTDEDPETVEVSRIFEVKNNVSFSII